MKNLVSLVISIVFFFLLVNNLSAQQKFIAKAGNASFFSEAPLENIEAHNKEVQSIIDLESKKVVVNMMMKAFHFDKSLMEEHFNENYIESEKYPKASFNGAYTTNEAIAMGKDGVYNVKVSGELTIHGVTHTIEAPGTIEIKGKNVIAKTTFKVKLEDYKIKIPKIVFKNIAEIVDVTIDIPYVKFES
ncbi:MAG: YceI family protein [Bacteroidota bacterium]